LSEFGKLLRGKGGRKNDPSGHPLVKNEGTQNPTNRPSLKKGKCVLVNRWSKKRDKFFGKIWLGGQGQTGMGDGRKIRQVIRETAPHTQERRDILKALVCRETVA